MGHDDRPADGARRPRRTRWSRPRRATASATRSPSRSAPLGRAPRTTRVASRSSSTRTCARTRSPSSGSRATPTASAFRTLIGVSNVGPKTAIAVLSALPAAELARAVTRGDVGKLTGDLGRRKEDRRAPRARAQATSSPTVGPPRHRQSPPRPRRRPATSELLHDALVAHGLSPDRGRPRRRGARRSASRRSRSGDPSAKRSPCSRSRLGLGRPPWNGRPRVHRRHARALRRRARRVGEASRRSRATRSTRPTSSKNAEHLIARAPRARRRPRRDVADRRATPRSSPSGMHAPGKPTLLVYGHHDVQPVDPLGEWIIAAVRAGDPRGPPVGPRRRRRQGPGLHPREGDRALHQDAPASSPST